MDRLTNAIRQQAAAMVAQMGRPRFGVVQSVDPSRPAAKVLIQPEGVLSGWLPIVTPAAAAGWGLMAVPVPGMMAFMIPDLGDAQHLVIVGFGHHDNNRPPNVPNTPGTGGNRNGGDAAAVGGEFLLVHQTGSFLRMCADGSILMSAANVHVDGNLTVNGTTTGYGTITSTAGDVIAAAGNVRAYLDVTDANQAHGTMGYLRTQYNAHQHTQPSDSHGDTEAIVNINDHQVP